VSRGSSFHFRLVTTIQDSLSFRRAAHLNTFVPTTPHSGAIVLEKPARVRFRHRKDFSLASLTQLWLASGRQHFSIFPSSPEAGRLNYMSMAQNGLWRAASPGPGPGRRRPRVMRMEFGTSFSSGPAGAFARRQVTDRKRWKRRFCLVPMSIIMDITMPVMNGPLRRPRQISRAQPHNSRNPVLHA